MPEREFHYTWAWELTSDPAVLWPLVADTNRFDRDSGVPPVEHLTELDAELRNGRCRVRLAKFGLSLEYEQQPFEWAHPHRFGVQRNYLRGPLESLRVRADLEPGDGGGTTLTYQVWARPRNLVGRLAIPIQIGVLFARSFERTFAQYDALAARGDPYADTSGRAGLSRAQSRRLAARRSELVAAGQPGRLVDRLIDHVASADGLSVARIRPYALADSWGAERRDLLDLALRATRSGLLGFQWDLLCPLCGVAKASAASLGELPAGVHCDTCNIDYEANFERSVELTFRPEPSIRPTTRDEYCIGGPMATPHVVAQRLVQPDETVVLGSVDEPGRYRVRAQELTGHASLLIRAGAPPGTVVMAGAWSDDEVEVGPGDPIEIVNTTGVEQLVVLDRVALSDQAVTAAEVTARQEFRDLFATEALRPGERIEVGSMAVLFTDLRGSTRLYQEVGDAVAFGRVLDHFEVLRRHVGAEGGAVVKTIGDAVMATFRTPGGAVRAFLAAQAEVAGATPGLELKGGIHFGPCIAVTLNGQLDYFGSTVNLAARLEGLSTATDVVVSASVHDDPEVQDLLAAGGAEAAAVTAELKGFDDEFRLWRVRVVAG